jgi:hypothetical protein
MPLPSDEVSIASALAHARVRAIRTALLGLHKVLIDIEVRRYSRANAHVDSAHHALQLVLRDPWFAWLRPISELIVRADERLNDDRPVSVEEAEAYASQTLGLLQQDQGGADFRREYHRSLQEQPDVVVAHANVVKLAAKGT